MLRRRRVRTVVTMLGVGSAISAGACIIADPPTDFPQPVEHRPTILRDRAVPPTSSVLGVFPSSFLVEVEADPNATVAWHLFIDYNPFNGNGLVGRDAAAPDNPNAPDAGVRQISILQTDTTVTPDLGRCHVIEAMVALGFQSDEGRLAHEFDSRGGDSIVWFYSPTGDLSGCPVYDAGLDGAAPDVQVDGLFSVDGAGG
jgi:hypothetical protein